MQRRGETNNRKNKSVSKPILLGLTTAIIIGAVTPLVIPHISHPLMIYHIILHIASMIIAVFLALVSYLAYRRAQGTRMLLMTVGFMALGIVEVLYFLDVTGEFPLLYLPASNIELSHAVLLIMLALFGLGVLNKSSSGAP